ncbi:hypothetical protein GBF38_002829, partial [Nibea albiflora]
TAGRDSSESGEKKENSGSSSACTGMYEKQCCREEVVDLLSGSS